MRTLDSNKFIGTPMTEESLQSIQKRQMNIQTAVTLIGLWCGNLLASLIIYAVDGKFDISYQIVMVIFAIIGIIGIIMLFINIRRS